MLPNVIFDWSGTLSDDFELTYRANMGVFRALGLPEMPRDRFRREFVLPYMDFYRPHTAAPQARIDELFHDLLPKLDCPQRLYPGVEETLRGLARRGLRLALLSSCPNYKLEAELRRSGISDLFQDICGDAADKGDEIQPLLQRNGFLPAATAYVGDMTHDLDTGRDAGLLTIAITWGYQSRAQLAACRPHHLIDDIKELPALLAK